jgi:serine protease inhibitor
MNKTILSSVIASLLAAGGALADGNEKAIVAGNTAFACDLYGKLKGQEGNLFLSPYSISTALAMTYAGARGETKTQMERTLHFGRGDVHPSFAALQDGLKAVQKKGQVQLATANSLWPQKGSAFLPTFLDLCQKHYGVTITPVDFSTETESARQSINNWFEKRTNHKIQELFKPGLLTPLTRLVLGNAVYFKGTWSTQFDKQNTKPAPFHLTAEKKLQAPLMYLESKFRYTETPSLQVLELPYAGDDLSMLVLLPRKLDGLGALEDKLNAETLTAWTQGLRLLKARAWLPQFKTTGEFSLKQTLAALGMSDAFVDKSDFSGMNGLKDLFISDVVHKAFVEVNEAGTEAAAATGVAMAAKSMPRPEPQPVEFRADHPFLFIIRDNKTGSVLFLGRMVDPTK